MACLTAFRSEYCWKTLIINIFINTIRIHMGFQNAILVFEMFTPTQQTHLIISVLVPLCRVVNLPVQQVELPRFDQFSWISPWRHTLFHAYFVQVKTVPVEWRYIILFCVRKVVHSFTGVCEKFIS